jgi:hypothetical protein
VGPARAPTGRGRWYRSRLNGALRAVQSAARRPGRRAAGRWGSVRGRGRAVCEPPAGLPIGVGGIPSPPSLRGNGGVVGFELGLGGLAASKRRHKAQWPYKMPRSRSILTVGTAGECWIPVHLPPPTASSLTFSLAMRRRENLRVLGDFPREALHCRTCKQRRLYSLSAVFLSTSGQREFGTDFLCD